MVLSSVLFSNPAKAAGDEQAGERCLLTGGGAKPVCSSTGGGRGAVPVPYDDDATEKGYDDVGRYGLTDGNALVP